MLASFDLQYDPGTVQLYDLFSMVLVPFISLMLEIQPVKFGPEFALAASLYLFSKLCGEH
jgi:hypothetical protein